MLSKLLIEEVLEKALCTGGDFSELFIENTIKNSISMVDGKVESSVSGRNFGIGIRIFKGFNSVYAYTNESGRESLLEMAMKAASAMLDIDKKRSIDINLTEKICSNIHPILLVPQHVEIAKKVNEMRKANAKAKAYSNEIVQVSVGYNDVDQSVTIANSEGLIASDRRIRSRIQISSIASDGVENQTGSERPGRKMGFEMFNNIDIEKFAEEASKTAVTMLHSEVCPAGKMPVVIDNGFGGVIFHEACGHSLEATSVAKGNSVFCDMIGKKIASDKVTAIDDGTMPNLWGSMNIDDEGTPAKRNVLIENGILKGYMVDKLNARRMNMDVTGSSRRESYKFAPTSRMTNTFIANGEDDNDTIIASVNDGLYAKRMGGGSVNPATGEFNFAVREGYLIKGGKIDKPVRGATLIGKGSDVLLNIDMVGNNLDHDQGMCGSASGSIPTNVGQPMIRVSEMTVGGRG